MTNNINVRALALETLTEIDREDRNASEAIQATLRNYQYLDKKDRSFYTRICQGTLEYRIQLDYLIDQVSKTPVRKCKPYIRNLLRMSLYQIRYMDRSLNAAVCNEAVKLAKMKGFQNLSGFVNGVLRNLIRQQEQLQLPKLPSALPETSSKEKQQQYEKELQTYYSITYSVPEWLVEKLLTWYSNDIVEAVLRAFLRESPLCVRVNLLKTTTEDVKQELEAAGIHVEYGNYCKNILQLSEYNYLKRIPAFRTGSITVQDESSCLQGYLLCLNEVYQNLEMQGSAPDSLCILDICAAPGGKAMYAAEQLQMAAGNLQAGWILARDVSEFKTERIRENVERMGYENIRIQVWDALQFDEAMAGKADVLIADVPCSGLGVLGRKQDIKYRMKPEQLSELVRLQRQIVETSVPYLKPDGYLIYSTCTLNPAENEEQIRWMEETLGLEAVSIRDCLPEKLTLEIEHQTGTDLDAGYCTLLPGLQACDGFFLAKLRKKKSDVRSMKYEELKEYCIRHGWQKFRLEQIYSWIHQKLVRSPEEMLNIPKDIRTVLQADWIGVEEEARYVSKVDGTHKFLFRLVDGNLIESVWMPYKHGNSVCISSQVGCRMGCRFCASTVDGMVRNLTASEMLDQVYAMQYLMGQRISNIVVMGSGEPMDNYDNLIRFLHLVTDERGLNISQRNITVSSCGLVPEIRRFAKEGLAVTLALSLHAVTDEERRDFMPIARKYSIKEILEACQYYFEQTGRRVTYEYSLIRGVNDSADHARRLAALLQNQRPCHVNLIPVNPIEERQYEKTTEKTAQNFKYVLENTQINVTIRRGMGSDIDAACGQLRRKYIRGEMTPTSIGGEPASRS